MTGAEMYAALAHLKTTQGAMAAALDESLLKLKRPLDKKLALIDWISENRRVDPRRRRRRGGAALQPDGGRRRPTRRCRRCARAATSRWRRRRSRAPRAWTAPRPRPHRARSWATTRRASRAPLRPGHPTMSGAGTTATVPKAHGHESIEDELMRKRLLPEKAGLVAHIKAHHASLVGQLSSSAPSLASTMPMPAAPPMLMPAAARARRAGDTTPAHVPVPIAAAAPPVAAEAPPSRRAAAALADALGDHPRAHAQEHGGLVRLCGRVRAGRPEAGARARAAARAVQG